MTEPSPSSVERVRRLNEFAKPMYPGIVGVTAELGAGLRHARRLAVRGRHRRESAGRREFHDGRAEDHFLGTVREGGAIRGRATQVWDVAVEDELHGKVIALFRCTQMALHEPR